MVRYLDDNYDEVAHSFDTSDIDPNAQMDI